MVIVAKVQMMGMIPSVVAASMVVASRTLVGVTRAFFDIQQYQQVLKLLRKHIAFSPCLISSVGRFSQVPHFVSLMKASGNEKNNYKNLNVFLVISR